MKIIIALFCCLGLIGCTTAAKEHKVSCPAAKNNVVAVDQQELDNMISVFSSAINDKPNYAGAYYNRAVAYYYKKDYDKSWQDVRKVQELSSEFDPSLAQLTKKLSKASGRDK